MIMVVFMSKKYVNGEMMYRYNAAGVGRAILLFSIVLFAVTQVSAAQVAAIDDALSMSNLKITPQPIVAGDNVTFTFQLVNSYKYTLYDTNLQLTASNPILNVSPSSTTFIYSIGQGSYGNSGFDQLLYNVHIPSTLNEGEYTIDVTATYETTYNTGATETDVPGTSVMPIQLYVYGTPNVELSVNPVGLINPGGYATLDLSAVNGGTGDAHNVTLHVVSSDAFEVYGQGNFYLGEVATGGTGSAEITMLAAPNLTTGVYYIPVVETYSTSSGAAVNKTLEVPLNIVTSEPDVAVSIASTMPALLYPGSNTTATLLIQNLGQGEAKNLTVSLADGNGITISSTASSFFIGTLQEGESTTETVLISANRSIGSDNRTVPVYLNYQDAMHTHDFSTAQKLGIRVSPAAVFNITNVSDSLLPGTSYGMVVFTVKNTGNEPAQEVTFSLDTIYPINPANPNYYIAQINPGQSVNVTFYVNVDSNGKPGVYPITLYSQWRQPNGYTTQQYSGSNSYYAVVNGSSGSGLVDGIIMAVMVILALTVAYKRFLPNKRENVKRKV